jgi:hypothetical protein
MPRLNLEPIRERLGAASPGPWAVNRFENRHSSNAGDGQTYPAVRGFRAPKRLYESAPKQVEADAAFMAAARHDVGVLLAEVVRLRRLVRELGGEDDEQPGDTSAVANMPAKQRFGVSRGTKSFKELWEAGTGTNGRNRP